MQKKGKYLVRKDYETDKRIAFYVLNQEKMTKHSVIYNKLRNEWSCDCKWHTSGYPRTNKYCSQNKNLYNKNTFLIFVLR